MRKLCVGCLFMVSALVHAQESITIREASRDNFIGTLVSDRELSIEDAQRRVLAVAVNTCKDRVPSFGHYDFNSSKGIPATAPAADRFEFNQNFSCRERAPADSVQRPSTAISEEEKKRLVELVTNETRKLIGSADIEAIRSFHATFSPGLSEMLPLAEWAEQQAEKHKNSGAIKANPSLKITTYIDPPNSPGPGIYIAVDFQAEYESAPFRCGYVMWLFDQQSNLSVLRIEDGIIYSKDAASMTTEALEQTRRQFRCFAP